MLGWLALEEMADENELGAVGNFGLMDQSFAMQWTQVCCERVMMLLSRPPCPTNVPTAIADTYTC